MRTTNLDMDVLRTLVAAVRLGGFGKAGESIGRSQSAVSLQMKRLEEQVGQSLFRKDGRNVALTGAGEMLLGYAGRILQLNDEAVAATRGIGLDETIRFGVPADLAEAFLPAVLANFSKLFPQVHIEARVDRNINLVEQVGRNALDLALAFGNHESENAQEVGRLPIRWIGNRQAQAPSGPEVTLVLFDAPCMFRDIGIAALDRAKLPWRVALTSPSLSGLWAATEAGLGISIRTPIGLPGNLKVLGNDAGLPQIAETMRLSIHANDAAPNRAVAHLREIALSSLSDLLENIA